MVQVPVAISEIWLLLTVHIDGVAEVKTMAFGEVELAEAVTSPEPKARFEMAVKVIDWLALLNVKVRNEEVALS